jgi:hypothetical protein
VIAYVENGRASSTSRTGAAKAAAGEHEGERVWRPVPVRNWGDTPIRTRQKVEKSMVAEEMEPF